MKAPIVLVVILAAVALGACRKETPYYEPMKLGADAQAEVSAR